LIILLLVVVAVADMEILEEEAVEELVVLELQPVFQ